VTCLLNSLVRDAVLHDFVEAVVCGDLNRELMFRNPRFAFIFPIPSTDESGRGRGWQPLGWQNPRGSVPREVVMKFRSVRDIIGNLEDWWPWHFSGDDDEKEKVDMNLNPVLLVPGIGGSILNAVNKNGRKERIWVRLFEADHEFRTKLYSFYNPETGRTDSLDENTTIEVPEDRHGLHSCDILDPDVVSYLFPFSLMSQLPFYVIQRF
jgi:hypothetical protein